MVKARLLAAVAIVAAVGAIASGRTAQVSSSPAFEVASIKPNSSGGRGTTMGMQPGRYTATNSARCPIDAEGEGRQREAQGGTWTRDTGSTRARPEAVLHHEDGTGTDVGGARSLIAESVARQRTNC